MKAAKKDFLFPLPAARPPRGVTLPRPQFRVFSSSPCGGGTLRATLPFHLPQPRIPFNSDGIFRG